MASKRDLLKQRNQIQNTEAEPKTIVDELVENFEKEEEQKAAPAEQEAPSQIINVIDKSRVGRPKILEGIYKPISARLKMENYEHARIAGGRFGGMNGYINWLIEQDMKSK